MLKRLCLRALVASVAACGGGGSAPPPAPAQSSGDAQDSSRFPLQLVADVDLPAGAVFDLSQPGPHAVDREHPGDASDSIAVDPSTHHVFFPLLAGPRGTPVLRIMHPVGT